MQTRQMVPQVAQAGDDEHVSIENERLLLIHNQSSLVTTPDIVSRFCPMTFVGWVGQA